MTVGWPLWLVLLIPWAGLVIYLMLGKPPREPVPFLWLWRGPEAKRRATPSISKLPVWIALLLLSAATAIVAAAGPGIERASPPLAVSQAPAITQVAVRGRQAMVRVANDSPRQDVAVTVKWDGGRFDLPLRPSWEGGELTTSVALPQKGERSYFLDLPIVPNDLDVSLDTGQRIEMTRQRTWPKIDALGPLPDALRRMLDVYAEHRPAGDDSATIGIATDPAALGDRPGVIVADAREERHGKVTVVDHRVTQQIGWHGVLLDAKLASPLPAGFMPLVQLDGRTAVAVRESPARQVWVGFDAAHFASGVNYVMFWSNVLDFTGHGGDTWELKPGTVLSRPTQGNPVQKRVQSLAAWVAVVAVALSAAGVAVAPRRPA